MIKLFSLKHILAETANGAYKILGNFFPGCAGSDAVIGIADFGIINISAGTNILFHNMVKVTGIR